MDGIKIDPWIKPTPINSWAWRFGRDLKMHFVVGEVITHREDMELGATKACATAGAEMHWSVIDESATGKLMKLGSLMRLEVVHVE